MYAGEWLQDLLLGVSPVLHIGNQQTRQRTRRKATNDGDIDTIQIGKRGIKFRLGHLRSHQVGRVELNIGSLKRPRPGPSCMRRRPRCKPAGCSRPSRPCRRRSRSKAQCKSNFLTEVHAGVQCLHTCRTIVQPGKQKGNLVRPPNDAKICELFGLGSRQASPRSNREDFLMLLCGGSAREDHSSGKTKGEPCEAFRSTQVYELFSSLISRRGAFAHRIL
jgi:hypothetical protein